MTPKQESMSDLTKRLREMAGGNEAHYCYEAADRIEQLERDLAAAPAPAPAAPAPEPVAWIEHHKAGDNLLWDEPGGKKTPLYAHPAPVAAPAPETVAWLDPSDPDADSCIVLDRIRKHGKDNGMEWWKRYSVPLYAAPPAVQSMEQRLRDALEAMGSKKAQTLTAGDLLQVVCDVDAPPAVQVEPVAWMVGNDPMTAATYNAGDKEKAFDAAKRWNWPITGLSVIAGAPDFDINYQQTKPVGEWRMKNGEPMHVIWRAKYKPQLGDKLYAAPPAVQQAEPVACTWITDSKCSYTMSAGHVCNKCGRIHDGRPNAAPPADDEAVRLLREAARCIKQAKRVLAPNTTNSDADVCIAAIDAYLAKVRDNVGTNRRRQASGSVTG